MTNPENAIGTNAAYSGRTSVNAFNDVLAAFSPKAGILRGWEPNVNDGGQVVLGGASGVRDVAIARDPNGNFTSVDNISGQPIVVTMPTRPISGSRTDAIVAYVTSPPNGSSAAQDNPAACGIVVVEGVNINTPTDSAIRQAITQDGAAGTTAYYVILAEVLRDSTELMITMGKIQPGEKSGVDSLFPVIASNINWVTTKINPKFMQCGNSTIQSFSPGSPGGEALVTFPTKFSNTPKVLCTLESASGTGSSITATGITTEGFSAISRLIVSSQAESASFSWVAIDPTQPPLIAA